MSTAIEAPPASPPSDPARGGGGHHSERRRIITQVVLLVLVAGAVGGFGLWMARYEPLCSSSLCGGGGLAGATGDSMQSLGSFDSPGGESFTAYRIPFHAGGTFTFSLSIQNHGPMGVTITHIGWPADPFERLPVKDVQVETLPAHPPTGFRPTYTPFRPMSLAPHSSVDVRVTVQMRGCVQEDTALRLGQIPVTYRGLFFTKHTTLVLEETIDAFGPKGATCPRL